MGYERVVSNQWRLERVQDEETGELENGDIERRADYSAFFAEMAVSSDQAANQCDQGYGYGCAKVSPTATPLLPWPPTALVSIP